MGVNRTLVLLIALLLPGCFWATTKHEGRKMRAQIRDLDARVTTQEQNVDVKVKKLDESLDKATKLLARNSADMGTQVDKMSDDVATLNGQVGTLQRTVEALRAELAQLRAAHDAKVAELTARLDSTGKGGSASALDKGILFDQAYRKLQAGQLVEARKDFRVFVQQFGSDDRADNAQYWVGQTFVREKDHEKAIAEFQRIIDRYPDGDMADDAFLAAGEAAISKRWCLEARAYLGELLRRHPRSPLARTAKQKLSHVRRYAKNKQVCQS